MRIDLGADLKLLRVERLLLDNIKFVTNDAWVVVIDIVGIPKFAQFVV